jgi:hypothetical protein
MGETRVDLYHLLEDLRDAYPGAIEETILTEIVANALDSGATRVSITTDPAAVAVTVLDNGSGMQRRALARYHDIASSTKARGQGIGFAGVGIKLGLLVSEEVVTESRRGKTHVATRWHLASRHKAPWKWAPPAGRVLERGTAVSLKLRNALSPLLDPGFAEGVLLRHYPSLFEPVFRDILAEHYPHGVRFEVGGHELPDAVHEAPETAPVEVRLARRRKPSAVGYLTRSPHALPEDWRGVAISTFGKVIKRGWDWLGITPSAPERIGGLIEVPALAECLTLNKADFIRSGPRGATYLAYRKAIQEAVTHQLGVWGDARDGGELPRRAARPVERDLERVLVDLAEDYPLLSSLVERRAGGQRRLPIGRGDLTSGRDLVASAVGLAIAEAEMAGEPAPPASTVESETPAESAAAPRADDRPAAASTLPAPAGGPRRPAHYGLSIQFEAREDDPELGRLVESTVWVNSAHPAYRRAAASRSEGYHLALSVAMALAALAVESAHERTFVQAFLGRWGSAVPPSGARRRG